MNYVDLSFFLKVILDKKQVERKAQNGYKTENCRIKQLLEISITV